MICIVLYVIFIAACGNKTAENTDEKTYTYSEYPFERNGYEIHLDCMISDNVTAEDNILLVHGLTYSSHEFDVNYKDYSLVRFLCDRGYAVWRIDITGYGQSEEIENGFIVDSRYASEDISVAIDKILSITGADDIDLLGWSWGTVTSTLAEAVRHDVIDKFVMYAPIITGLGAADITENHHINSWEHAASDFQMNEDGTVNLEITESCIVDTYCSNCWRYDGLTSPNGGRRDLCVDEDVELIDLSAIKDKTLVICGDADTCLNMTMIKSSLDKLPEGSELVVIGGGAHCIMMERPYYQEFREKLVSFLRD
ncbi:MAG: alpha/beta hydrolase [Spirochaetia bacterium]|nr:alpha/beta hydrolase [Spirochaetia bacterium]